MFFQVDLGETRLVGGFSLFLGDFLNDYPRGLKILVSPEGWRLAGDPGNNLCRICLESRSVG